MKSVSCSLTCPACLRQSWLYTLEQMRGSDSTVLTEDSVKMAAHFCLPVSSAPKRSTLVVRSLEQVFPLGTVQRFQKKH